LSNNNVLQKLNNLYLTEHSLNSNSVNYGITRQHNFSSMDSVLPSFTTLVDKKGFQKFYDYTLKDNTSYRATLSTSLSLGPMLGNVSSEANHNTDQAYLTHLKNWNINGNLFYSK
jgi:hypothetical protein